MVLFPAPIGGTVMQDDFAPSVLFVVLYSTLLSFVFRRLWWSRTRCLLLLGTIPFIIERIILFNLRSVQANVNNHSPFSTAFVTYQQISFGMGFIGIATDAVRLTKCLLVNATYGLEKYPESPAAGNKGGLMPPPSADTPDQPRTRSWHRMATFFLSLSFLVAFIIGIVGNSNYSKDIDSQANADLTAKLRVASTAIALSLLLFAVHITLQGFLKLPRINKRGVVILGVIYTLIIMIGTYRLSVMWIRTTSLTATSSLDTPSAKALFYVFHILPEWLAVAILLGDNVRETFGTGLFGAWRLWDETEKERVKRLAREAKRESPS
jgi:hypothetical protein